MRLLDRVIDGVAHFLIVSAPLAVALAIVVYTDADQLLGLLLGFVMGVAR